MLTGLVPAGTRSSEKARVAGVSVGRAVLARMPGGRQEASMGFLGLLVVGAEV